MITAFGRTLLLLTILALSLAGSAQHPLAGAWQETQIGFRVTFEQQPGGQLTGTLQGQAGPMPLNIVSDLRNVQGTFSLDGQTSGFAAQLQPDDSTLLIWLYEVDAAGQALQGSYEQYLAYRANAPAPGGGLPFPPAGGIPAGPGGGGSLPAPPIAGQPGMSGVGGVLPQPAAPVQPATPGSGPGPQQGDITGTWRTDDQFDDGTPFTAELKFDASGAWRVDLVAEGQPLAYFGGLYTFSQDGALRYQETSRSPQVCLRGQCQANSLPDSSGNDRVYFQDANTIVTTDSQSGEQTVYRRDTGALGLPQAPGFGVPGAAQPVAPPFAGGFPAAPPAGGGFPPAPPAAGGFPAAPPVAGGFPVAPAASPPGRRGPAAPVSASDFIGVWEAEQKIDASLTLKVVSSFGANGSWRHDFSHEGKPVAFYEGTFTVSPAGVLQLQVNNHSPQMCTRGTCQPAKKEDIIRTFQVTFQTSDTLTMAGKNSGGVEVRLTYQRSGRNGM